VAETRTCAACESIRPAIEFGFIGDVPYCHPTMRPGQTCYVRAVLRLEGDLERGRSKPSFIIRGAEARRHRAGPMTPEALIDLREKALRGSHGIAGLMSPNEVLALLDTIDHWKANHARQVENKRTASRIIGDMRAFFAVHYADALDAWDTDREAKR
jgi:hypothetical protein